MTTIDPYLVASLEPLSVAECWNKLATRRVGRVGLIVGHRPAVFPVNYAIDGETILFRTAEGSVLNRASLQIVAFEVDDVEATTHTGWSVLLQGLGRDIGNAIDSTSHRLRRLTLVTWAPGERQRWFHIQPDSVTGRLIRVLPDAL